MRPSEVCILAGLLMVGLTAAPAAGAASKDEQEIRTLEERFAAAVRAKDVDALMQAYVQGRELFVFDVDPPRQHVGFDDYKKDWQEFFSAFPGPVDKFEVDDLHIVAGRTLAYSRNIQPLIVTAKDGSKFSITLRVTDCYRKINGRWLIVMEHVSVPVNLESGKADLTSKP